MATDQLQTVVLHGDQLKYVDQGSGPVVVLIHGLLGAHSNWGTADRDALASLPA
nr:hypothetical protein [Rhodococcus erythropolis]